MAGAQVAPQKLPSALEQQAHIHHQFRGRPALLFLDYDGTLAPISPRPEIARMSEPMRETVAALAGFCPVAVISGRALPNIREHVGLENIHYAGNHGLEIDGPRMVRQDKAALAARHALDRAYDAICRSTEAIEGVLIEHKGLSLSVHYRLTPVRQQEAVANATITAANAEPELRIHDGKCQFELRPATRCNKGTAVLLLRDTLDPDHRLLPLYIGDDRTDEDAFEALRDHGITILVSDTPRQTAAQYHLPAPLSVQSFLEELHRFLVNCPG